jgi:hypothetical protein
LEILVHAYLRDVHYSTRRKTIFNVIYANLNAGLVALPMAAEFGGIPLFVIAVIFVAVASGYSSCIVVNLFTEQGVRTLEDLSTKGYGRSGFIITCAFELLLSLSLMCITLDVWADISSYVFSTFAHMPIQLTHRSFGLLIGSLMILPLCLFGRSMAKLGWSSIFSVISILAAVCCLVAAMACDLDGGHNGIKDRTQPKFLCRGTKLWWILPLIVTFCFANNQKSFAAYSSLRRRSAHRWKYVVKRSHASLALMYIAFGVLGYLSDVKTNRTLTNVDYFLEFEGKGKARVYFDVLSAVVAFSLLLTVPVDCLVATTTCRRLYVKLFRRKRRNACSKILDSVHSCCGRLFGGLGHNVEDRNAGYAAVRRSDLVDYDDIYSHNRQSGGHMDHNDGSAGSRARNVDEPQAKDYADKRRDISIEGSSTSSDYVDSQTKYRGDTWCSDDVLSPYAVKVAEDAERRGVLLSDDTPVIRPNSRNKDSTTDKLGWRSFLDGESSPSLNDAVNQSTTVNVMHVPDSVKAASSNVSSISASSDTLPNTNKSKVTSNVSNKKMEALRVTTSDVISVGSFDSRSTSCDIAVRERPRAESDEDAVASTISNVSPRGKATPVKVVETILETASDSATSVGAGASATSEGVPDPVTSTNTAVNGNNSSPSRNAHKQNVQGINNNSKFLSAQHAAVRKASSNNSFLAGGGGNYKSPGGAATAGEVAERPPRASPIHFPAVRKAASANDVDRNSHHHKQPKSAYLSDSQSSKSVSSQQSDTPHLDALMAAIAHERKLSKSSKGSRHSFSQQGVTGSHHSSYRSHHSVDSGHKHSDTDVYFEPRHVDSDDDDDGNDEEDEEDIQFTFDSQRFDYPNARRNKLGRGHRHLEDGATTDLHSAINDDISGEEADPDGNDEVIDAADIDEHYRILQQRRTAENTSICDISEIGPVFLIWAFTLLLCASYEHFGMIGTYCVAN